MRLPGQTTIQISIPAVLVTSTTVPENAQALLRSAGMDIALMHGRITEGRPIVQLSRQKQFMNRDDLAADKRG